MDKSDQESATDPLPMTVKGMRQTFLYHMKEGTAETDVLTAAFNAGATSTVLLLDQAVKYLSVDQIVALFGTLSAEARSIRESEMGLRPTTPEAAPCASDSCGSKVTTPPSTKT